MLGRAGGGVSSNVRGTETLMLMEITSQKVATRSVWYRNKDCKCMVTDLERFLLHGASKYGDTPKCTQCSCNCLL